MHTPIRHLPLPVLALTLAACGGGESDVTPVINSFTLSADSTSAGGTVEVSWDVLDATAVTIKQGPDAVIVADDARATGSVTSNPIDSAVTFELTAVNSESGNMATATAEIIGVTGIRIAEFTASETEVDEDTEITLRWVVGGEDPTDVEIRDGDFETIYEGADREGSVAVTPEGGEDEQQTYLLTIRGPSGMDTAELTITVNNIITTPTIVLFEATSTDVAKGDRAQLRWEIQDAERFQILLNGNQARQWIDLTEQPGQAMANARITVRDDTNVFTLEAESEDGVSVTQDITVRGLDVPVIDDFTVTPAEYASASTVATVTWATTFADSVNLTANGRDVPNFPRDMAAGTFQFTVTGRTELVLVATNPIQDTPATQTIELGFTDREPNDTAPAALPIAADGVPVRGTISDATDRDLYAVMVPQGAYLYAQVGFDAQSGCAFDTRLGLLDSDGTTELGFNDNTNAPDISPCSEINPLVSDFAANMAAGTYYLAVGGGADAMNNTGQYSLTVRIVMPVPGLGVTPLEVGDPTWQLADIVQFTSVIDGGSGDPSPGLDPIFRPMMQVDSPGSNFSAVMRPELPHQIDYSSELQFAMGMRGVPSGSTFDASAAQVPGALFLGFTMAPRVATATVGSSSDFASGPIMQTALFPLTVDIEIEQGGMALGLNADYDIPAHINLDPPVMGDGASHTHTFAFAPFSADAAPADLAGDFEWVVSVLDANNGGWTFRLPFTLRGQ